MIPTLISRFLPVAAGICALALSGCRLPQQTALQPGEELKKAVLPETAVVIPEVISDLNDIARYIAGMPGGMNSPLTSARQTEHWQRYSRNMDELWRRFSQIRQPGITAFVSARMGGLSSPDTLWYPFSGPDYLFANSFFPGARTTILCGLEGADMLPDLAAMSHSQREQGLDGLYTSLSTALSCSFFITKDMRVDLQATQFKGTLPVVLVFMARLGMDITSITPVSLDPAGGLVSGQTNNACPGYAIRCRDGFRSREVYYFKENLANGALGSDRRYLTFVSRFGSVATYLKSASYLMHTDEFSIIRKAILDQSYVVLEDDSGIPLRSFQDGRWSLSFHGNYSGVLDIFTSYYQPDLMKVFQDGGPNVMPMNFGIGYKFESGQSALILARKR